MKEKFTIIGVGASAGGLEALMDLLSHIPTQLQQVGFVIAQHLSPTHKSRWVELLGRSTTFSVVEAENGMSLAPKTVYITPPDSDIRIVQQKIKLSKPTNALGPKPSVDILFESLAKDLKGKAVGIILSGTGSDGAKGVKDLKEAGSYVLVQEPSTAKYDGMPMAAINTRLVDLVLLAEKMGEELLLMLQDPDNIMLTQKPIVIELDSLHKIFKLLSKRTGTDFSNYKPATIGRRLEKRLLALKIRDIDTYLDYINKNEQELDALFESILIGVTSFFRDIEVFNKLESYLAKIISQKARGDSIRIWIAGCATGEEPYSIAILLSKLLGTNILNYHIQIFATDIDEVAIRRARKGVYSPTTLEGIPDEIIQQYFLKKDDQYELIKQIRSMVLFSKHDLTHNPPFLKLDLISCRNLLIYFGANLQKQVIPVFHYALHQSGYLLLGKSESIGQFAHLFSTVDAKNKIFQRKKGVKSFPIRFNTSVSTTKKETVIVNVPKKSVGEYTVEEMLKETFFTSFEHPYVVVNEAFDIIEIRGDIRLYLSLREGVVNMNVTKLVHPDLQIELRAILVKIVKEKKIIKGKIRKLEVSGNTHYVQLVVKPVLFADDTNKLFVIIFENIDISSLPINFVEDNTSDAAKEENIRMIELEQELSITKEHLQSYIEELETSNEELQSLNEEIQSTNEELQSSNEELETSNEELQSTNEEVQVAYEELKAANDELERAEALLLTSEANIKALLNNSLKASVLIDKQYKVITCNARAVEMFSIISDKKMEVNESIIGLIPSYLLPTFYQDISESLGKKFVRNKEYVFVVDNKNYWFLVNYTPVVDVAGNVNVVSFGALDITDLKQLQVDLNASSSLLTSIFDVSSVGICITDKNGNFVNINREYCKIYGYEKEELIGQPFTVVVPPENRQFVQTMHDDFIAGKPEMPDEWRVMKKDGTIIDIFVTASLLTREDGTRLKVTCVNDITAKKAYEIERTKLVDDLVQQNKDLLQFSFIVSHNLRAQVANMLGLHDLVEMDTITHEDTVEILGKIKYAATNLDNIIFDLNKILNVRNISESRQQIDWSEIIETIKIDLHKQVEDSQAQITTDIQVASIFSVKGFIHSIIYNLISNAIKYKSPERKHEIYIKIYQEESNIMLTITDNGLGIDLTNQKGKIFGLYRRFHFHTEGKGIGLYTVKTQVETLGGKIEIESTVGKGTTFKISLPANHTEVF